MGKEDGHFEEGFNREHITSDGFTFDAHTLPAEGGFDKHFRLIHDETGLELHGGHHIPFEAPGAARESATSIGGFGENWNASWTPSRNNPANGKLETLFERQRKQRKERRQGPGEDPQTPKFK